jgi:5-methyltetrahydrofolate--homocysteine methyltransferase
MDKPAARGTDTGAQDKREPMIEALMRLLGRDWLLADGATGTNLFAMGLTAGDAPEFWNETHPERIRALHQSFVDAGADIILTNTFGANARRLALHGAERRVRDLNRLAAAIARDVADGAGRPILVAGSVGPTGDLLAPLGPLTEAAAEAVFAEQIAGLREGGADLAWIETMSSVEEMRAAAAAAARQDMPCTVTASFDTAGNTMMGVTPQAMARAAAQFAPPPHAIGCNCGVGASDLVCSVLAMTEAQPDAQSDAQPDAIVVAKANCGIPTVGAEGTVYSGTPDLMADYARLACDAGARIIGGCCGTTPAHLAAMHAALAAHRRGARPSTEQVIARLGALVSPPATAATRRANRRRA